MNPELEKLARKQHQNLLDTVEQAVARLYAAKERNDHLNIWYAVTALEIYKMQSTLRFDMLLSGLISTTEQKAQISAMSNALSEQLETITEMCRPLLLGEEASSGE